jgi:hypothetical protein
MCARLIWCPQMTWRGKKTSPLLVFSSRSKPLYEASGGAEYKVHAYFILPGQVGQPRIILTEVASLAPCNPAKSCGVTGGPQRHTGPYLCTHRESHPLDWVWIRSADQSRCGGKKGKVQKLSMGRGLRPFPWLSCVERAGGAFFFFLFLGSKPTCCAQPGLPGRHQGLRGGVR